MIVSSRMAEEAWGTLLAYEFPGERVGSPMPESADVVNFSYRKAAKNAHPDAGGSPEAFAAVDRAKHVLLHWLARKEDQAERPHGGVSKCPRCLGKGYLEAQARAFAAPMRKQCPTCQGNGEIYDEKDKDGDRI